MSIPAINMGAKKLNIESVEYRGLTWIHVEKPTQAETEYLDQRFLLNPLNLEDVLSRHVRPKIEEYPSYLFIVLHFPVYDQDNQAIISSEVDVFIGEDYLITINCTGKLKGLSRFHHTCQTDEKVRKEYLSQGPGYLLFRILDSMVDRRLSLIDRIGDSIEDIEEKIFCEKAQGTVREISTLRRDIISFRRAVWPMRGVVNSLGKQIGRFAKIELKDDFQDLVDQLERIWDALEECKEIVEGLSDTYNALAANRTNDILRILTVVMTIGTILTVYVGFYGMNIPLGPLGGANPGGNPFAWVWLLALGLVLSIGMVVYSIRKGWL